MASVRVPHGAHRRLAAWPAAGLLLGLLAAAPVSAQPAGDADGDGLPDAWELQVGLDPLSAAGADGALGDPDGDGLANRDELAAGSHPRGFVTRYFAEGATGTFFDVRFAVFNASARPARIVMRFLTTAGATLRHAFVLPAGGRSEVDPETLPGLDNTAFSTVVEADTRIAVDRTMLWDSRHYGSHAEGGIESPSTQWFFAEGATHSGFQLFYLLQNPNPTTVDVDITYLRPNRPALTRRYAVGPHSRMNVWVNKEDSRLAWTDVSAAILSSAPIVVERAMYLNAGGRTFGAGHASAGITHTSTRWFLAEGATGPMFDLFVLLANPGATTAEVRVTYLLPDGTSFDKPYRVAARSRYTIWVDHEDARLADTAVSTLVESTNGVPIVVERAMWWPGPTPASWTEAHNAAGATATATSWALAGGEVGGADGTETYVLVANTSDRAGRVRATFFFEDGGTAVRLLALPARSRSTIAVAADVPSSRGRRFSVLVESLAPDLVEIVVERAMYSNAEGRLWAAGTAMLGDIVQDSPYGRPPEPGGVRVSVSAADNRAAEGTGDAALVTFSRPSGAGELTVAYRLAGSASPADVAPLSGLVTFADGQTEVALPIVPVDDALVEPPEVLVVGLVPGPGYLPAQSAAATLILLDNDAPVAPPGLNDAARLLAQATFGPSMADIARLQAIGVEAWLQEQFTAPRSDFVGYLRFFSGNEYIDEPHVQEAWVHYAATGPDQLRQRVANALLEIMVVANKNGLQGASWAHAAYMDVLMTHAFGNFRTLLREVTLNPAMGRFLDMLQNDREDPFTGQKPNENFAREVLQLFTIGTHLLNLDGSPVIGPDGRPVPAYGQAEVDGFSKVFTGWTFAQSRTPYEFWEVRPDWLRPMVAVPAHHSPGPKTLLRGVVLPAGQTPERDLEDAIDNIFHHPNVGPFIAERLIQRLVTSNPSRAYVARVASVFNDNGAGVRGDLKAVVRAILLDPEARDAAFSRWSMYGKLREPMIRFVSVVRAFRARPQSNRFRIWDLDRDMGQAPFRAPSVFNFFSPDFAPEGLLSELGLRAPEFEITTEPAVIVATNTMRRLVRDAYGVSALDKLRLDLSEELALAGDPAALVDRLNTLLFAGGLSPELAAIARDLASEIPPGEPLRRVQAVITLLVISPEFVVQK
jgi:uncharacterized protein (DUF1800 family)